MVEGATSLERPAPGPARGVLPVPAWVVVALACALVAAGVAWATRRFRPRGAS